MRRESLPAGDSSGATPIGDGDGLFVCADDIIGELTNKSIAAAATSDSLLASGMAIFSLNIERWRVADAAWPNPRL